MKIIECPRDAMQGLPDFIPTDQKIKYLQALLQVGFHTLDFGSFVSSRAVPQMADTREVLHQLDLSGSTTKLLAIIANLRGAQEAVAHPEIAYLGYPLSVSETFQHLNTNKGIGEALAELSQIHELCGQQGKTLVVYLSMGFGNPYGDPWAPDLVGDFVARLDNLGVATVALSDTVGVGTPESIGYLFGHLVPVFPQIEFGAHLHTTPDAWRPKVEAAYAAGCRRFDAALRGYGGCPMANNALVGNLATENLVAYLENIGVPLPLNKKAFAGALQHSFAVFA